MRFSVTACLIILIACSSVQAVIINVPDDFIYIQDGIDAANENDTVLVRRGRYVENIHFENRTIILASHFLLDENQDIIENTVIDGDGNGSVIRIRGGDLGEVHVIGFTIRNGQAQSGGGIHCYGGGSLTISHCVVRENTAEGDGGGIYCSAENAIIENCIIQGNNALLGGGIWISTGTVIAECTVISNESRNHGGGIYLHGNNPSVFKCTISDNHAPAGGGISSHAQNPTIIECIINRNEVTAYGGGLSVHASNPIINKCLIIGNSALSENIGGGGIYCRFSRLVFINCTIYGNTANRGGGLLCNGNTHPVYLNNISFNNNPEEIHFFGQDEPNSIDVSFSDIEGNEDGIVINNNCEVNWGDGNIDENPLLVDPENDDFSLTYSSPCIDTGDPESPIEPDGTCADMGAYYFHQQDIGIEQEALNFGHVEFGQVDSLELIIQNYGKRPLTINSQTITQDEPAFLIGSGGGEVLIEPESAHSTWVLFSPPGMDQYLGSIEIESDDLDESIIQVAIQGESVLSVNPNENKLPGKFELSDAYPNPFNAKTTLTYSLPIPSQVSIRIHDISGRIIATLIDALQPAGNHSVVWNGNDAGSGVYFVRMETVDFSDVRKVMLLR